MRSFAHDELLDYANSLADHGRFIKKSIKCNLMDEIEKSEKN